PRTRARSPDVCQIPGRVPDPRTCARSRTCAGSPGRAPDPRARDVRSVLLAVSPLDQGVPQLLAGAEVNVVVVHDADDDEAAARARVHVAGQGHDVVDGPGLDVSVAALFAPAQPVAGSAVHAEDGQRR